LSSPGERDGRTGLHRLADWTLPPVLRAALLAAAARARHALASPEARRLLARNAEFRDRHRGQRCFVLATGPSIQRQDLSALAGEHLIAVSNFFVHPLFAKLAPRYYCVAPFHPPLTETAYHNWLAEMGSAQSALPECTAFFDLADLGRVRAAGTFRDERVRFVATSPHARPARPRLTGLLRSPQSITLLALQVAIDLGFAEVQLLGCDHDWILHLGESRHFYAESEHAANRAGYDEWFGANVGAYCADYVRLWDQYLWIRGVAETAGVRILNATDGGLLDLFPRVRLESVLRRA
jgi:hypothetical protein